VRSGWYNLDMGSWEFRLRSPGGELFQEPCMVIFDSVGNVVASGTKALEMRGKIPARFHLVQPVKQGVIHDFEALLCFGEQLRERFPLKGGWRKPKVISNWPVSATEVEKEAQVEFLQALGFGKVVLLPTPISTALGAGLDVLESRGHMVLNLGGDHTEICILSLAEMVFSDAIDFSGNALNNEFTRLVKDKHGVLPGENSIEKAKREVLDFSPEASETAFSLVGIDLKSGLPRKVQLDPAAFREVALPLVEGFVQSIRESLEGTPPELAKDILERGIVMAGGGATIPGLGKLVSDRLGIQITVPQYPVEVVLEGQSRFLEQVALRKKLPSVAFG